MGEPYPSCSLSENGEASVDPVLEWMDEGSSDGLPKIKRRSSLPMNYERRTTFKVKFPDRPVKGLPMFSGRGHFSRMMLKSGGSSQYSPTQHQNELRDGTKECIEQFQQHELRRGASSSLEPNKSSEIKPNAFLESSKSAEVGAWIKKAAVTADKILVADTTIAQIPEGKMWKNAVKWVDGHHIGSSLQSLKRLFPFEKVPKSHL